MGDMYWVYCRNRSNLLTGAGLQRIPREVDSWTDHFAWNVWVGRIF